MALTASNALIGSSSIMETASISGPNEKNAVY